MANLPIDQRLARLTVHPDGITFEEALQALAAHLDRMGRTYIEVGLDPATKQIGYSFAATLNQSGS